MSMEEENLTTSNVTDGVCLKGNPKANFTHTGPCLCGTPVYFKEEKDTSWEEKNIEFHDPTCNIKPCFCSERDRKSDKDFNERLEKVNLECSNAYGFGKFPPELKQFIRQEREALLNEQADLRANRRWLRSHGSSMVATEIPHTSLLSE